MQIFKGEFKKKIATAVVKKVERYEVREVWATPTQIARRVALKELAQETQASIKHFEEEIRQLYRELARIQAKRAELESQIHSAV